MNLLEAKRKLRAAGYQLTEVSSLKDKDTYVTGLKASLAKLRKEIGNLDNITLSEPYWEYLTRTDLRSGIQCTIQYHMNVGRRTIVMNMGNVFIRNSGKIVFSIPVYTIEAKFKADYEDDKTFLKGRPLSFTAKINNGSWSEGGACGASDPGAYKSINSWSEAKSLIQANIKVTEEFYDTYISLDNGKGHRD